MRQLYDSISRGLSKDITKRYSTSFSLATKMLSTEIRQDIYNIYGFVRLADEIVDTFHDFDKERMLNDLEREAKFAIVDGISINPVVNAYQETINRYQIPMHLTQSFLDSMRMDLSKKDYLTEAEYKRYIYGSADVVGLMCLMVFVKGDVDKYEALKEPAMRLGSAFQKVNFLRDLKADIENLERSYFPHIDMRKLDLESKEVIIREIEHDFAVGYSGITQLPEEARFGVYTAYRYYRKLLEKLKATPHDRIMKERIRVPDHVKFSLLAKSYLRNNLNLL